LVLDLFGEFFKILKFGFLTSEVRDTLSPKEQIDIVERLITQRDLVISSLQSNLPSLFNRNKGGGGQADSFGVGGIPELDDVNSAKTKGVIWGGGL